MKSYLKIVKLSTLAAMLLLFSGITLSAQTVHLILAPDANSNIGGYTQTDANSICTLFLKNIAANQLEHKWIDKDNMTPERILEEIEQMSVSSNDTIIFYYSGHGAHDSRNGLYYDLACHKQLLHNALRKKLEAKGCRQVVILSDCCNALQNIPLGNIAQAKSVPSQTTYPLFNQLFLESQGTIDIVSAEKGWLSWTYSKNPRDGSIFTGVLCKYLGKNRNESHLEWKKVFNEIRDKTDSEFKRIAPNGYKLYDLPNQPLQTEQKPYAFSLGKGHVPPVSDGPVFGVRAEARNGLLYVTEVARGYPGEKAKIRRGDIILEIDGKRLRTQKDYSDAIDNAGSSIKFILRAPDGVEYEGKANLR